jgi:Phosphodiester glycosidase
MTAMHSGILARATRLGAAAAAVVALALVRPMAQALDLGAPRPLARGVDVFHLTDPALLNPAATVSLWLVRLDPAEVDIKSALANDEIVGTEGVAEIAKRRAALLAINAGFFAPNGDPAGVLKIDGEVVSDTRRARGAVGIVSRSAGLGLLFGRVRLSVTAAITPAGAETTRIRLDGVDTTRVRGGLMLYTPSYHANTDTAPAGTEWTIAGSPPSITAKASGQGSTPIPAGGYVLSYGGVTPPPILDPLTVGARVRFETRYEAVDGMVEPWATARDIVGGAGLLARKGNYLTEWAAEKLTAGFPETRHPRTAIGVDRDGRVWLLVVDGRQPQLSSGMNFAEMQALGRRLNLTDLLNLDGGGSTTLWVQGTILNSPSDATGPRKVSDALLVFSRPR